MGKKTLTPQVMQRPRDRLKLGLLKSSFQWSNCRPSAIQNSVSARSHRNLSLDRLESRDRSIGWTMSSELIEGNERTPTSR
jgi:hypothetical protein